LYSRERENAGLNGLRPLLLHVAQRPTDRAPGCSASRLAVVLAVVGSGPRLTLGQEALEFARELLGRGDHAVFADERGPDRLILHIGVVALLERPNHLQGLLV